MIRIERAVFDPDLLAFLRDHLDELAPTAPPESRHALTATRLRGDDVRLWTALDGRVVGTAALAEIEPGHEELKSMRTDPARRGRGVARALLRHLFADAEARGVRRVSLETGTSDFFAPARALYADSGFVECPPFGRYVPDPNSVFMTRRR